MFCMVTLVASCIHVYSDRLHARRAARGDRPRSHAAQTASTCSAAGRFHRFFQYLSLFCFSMLGLVHRRQHGDGVRVLGTGGHLLLLPDRLLHRAQERLERGQQGVHRQPRRRFRHDHRPDGPLGAAWARSPSATSSDADGSKRAGHLQPGPPGRGHTRSACPTAWCGCRPAKRWPRSFAIWPQASARISNGPSPPRSRPGEAAARTARDRATATGCWSSPGWASSAAASARAPSSRCTSGCPTRWKAPRPCRALIHAATMVAAGVYLVGRFYPVFTPEVLLVIALRRLHHAVHRRHDRHHGHRHQARAGLFDRQPAGLHDAGPGRRRLAGRAVPPVHARLLQVPAVPLLRLGDPRLHTNEMPQMGGLRKKMPCTACTMLVGCLAIAGAGIPLVIGLSGFYSKDRILAQACSFMLHERNRDFVAGLLFYVAAGGAAITAFYMFRLWYMTFAGKPREPASLRSRPRIAAGDDRAAGGPGRVRHVRRLAAVRPGPAGQLERRDSAGAGPAGGHADGYGVASGRA